MMNHSIYNVDDKNPQTSALILAIIPIMTVFGNALVVLAVYREKSLQTVTNYLIVSLAISDFLVSLIIFYFNQFIFFY